MRRRRRSWQEERFLSTKTLRADTKPRRHQVRREALLGVFYLAHATVPVLDRVMSGSVTANPEGMTGL